jgi:hypothetical protein
VFENLIKKVYTKINNWIYSDQKIESLIQTAINAHLDQNEFQNVNINIYVIEHFEKEEIEIIEKCEPGSTGGGIAENILAITSVSSETDIDIIFSLEGIRDFLTKTNPLIAWSEIMDIAKHEAFHARQYNYILQNGGMEALEKLTEYIKQSNYSDNIIEEGAFAYQFDNVVQDFSVFDRFCNK